MRVCDAAIFVGLGAERPLQMCICMRIRAHYQNVCKVHVGAAKSLRKLTVSV